MAATAGAQSGDGLPTPGISIDRSQIGQGRFRLDFELPDHIELGPTAHYLRIHVDDGVEAWSFATLNANESISSQTPGEQRIHAQVCLSEPTRRQECGPISDEIRVRIPDSVKVTTPEPSGDEFGSSSVGGPALTHPGSFISQKTRYNAWQLMWLNSLIRQQALGAEDPPFFELLVRWLTYEYDPILERYIPIWLWAQLEPPSSGNTFSGALRYRRLDNGKQVDLVIGMVEITPNARDPKQVSVRWRSQRGGMYASQDTNTWVADTLEFADNLAPGDEPAPHDHYLGDWSTLSSSGALDPAASMVIWIENNQESLKFVFFDNAGRPVWARADWGNAQIAPPGTGREEFCAFTVFDATAPDTVTPAGHEVTVEWLGDCDNTSGANVARSYDPVGPGPERGGRIWADLQLPSYRPGRLVLGSRSSLDLMVKLSHFHDIRPVIGGVDGKTDCDVSVGQQCTLDLRWVLEGVYPEAAVYRKTLPSGTPQRIFSNIPGSQVAQAHTLPGDGRYEFQIRRTGSATSTLLARSHPVEVTTVAAEVPPDPIDDPAFVADPASITTGATRGEFRVTEAGAASYRIPVMTAPSGGGMAPQLALTYNSQFGNGVAGLGWSLDGIGAITRCSKTLETDGVSGGVDLTSNDRFCLDGQRLVQISGGTYGGNGVEYRLEVDQIVRIRSFGSQGGGPAYFKVWRKDGTVSWYGAIDRAGSQGGGSRVSSKLGPAWSWNLGRVEDSAGNFMQFVWEDKQASTPGVETVLARIDYSGHAAGTTERSPLHSITFEYELRPATDRSAAFVAGAELRRHYRLKRIISQAQGLELRRYNLAY
ncbi:MAG: SpvB/TcaC N-terminal domain-containing protein [Wenzhouxiangellaceae bacterium]|nr:SpvB/TcaC N-terminal domain-containing protein [Wenzhouxiangellaceae bacterium]